MNKIRTKEEIRHCQQVANEAFKQLFWSISKPIYWSWGVSRIQMTHYKEMPTLMLRVSGMVHKGWVLVSFDEASDTYVITLMNIKKEVKQTLSDIYCDTLGKTIDELVERPADMSDGTYRKKALQDSQRKWNQQDT